MKRVTDKWLAEIEASSDPDFDDMEYGDMNRIISKLLQGMKAERRFARKTIAVNSDLLETNAELEAEKANQSEYFDRYMDFMPGTNWLNIHTEVIRRSDNLSRINTKLEARIKAAKEIKPLGGIDHPRWVPYDLLMTILEQDDE